MSGVNHTPGRWTARRMHTGGFDILDERGRDVVTVYGGGVETESREANARLIAAAPDLLEALCEARDALHQHYVDWDGEPEDAVPLQLARAKCEAAIAKATAGETRNAEPIHRRDGDEG